MQREELYNKTVDILVDAYFNGTLISDDCSACACGNIIAARNEYKRVEFEDDVYWLNKNGQYLEPAWSSAVYTKTTRLLGFPIKKEQKLSMEDYKGETFRQISSTGYMLHEFAKIENAFERGYKGVDKMFNALMSVVDALDIIHGNKDTILTTTIKRKFNKQKLIPQ